MVQTPFPKRSLLNSGDFGTLTRALLVLLIKLVWRFQSPYGDCGTLTRHILECPARWERSFSPLTGIVVLNLRSKCRAFRGSWIVSVPLRGLGFLTAPLTDGFITPSKMAFAGRILFFCFFRDFLWKCLSQILQTRMFITSGQNVIKSINLFILYHIFNLKEIPHPPSYRHNKSPRKAIAASLRDFCPPMVQTPFSKRSPFNSGDFGTLTWALLVLLVKLVWRFQSPYGDCGS